MNTPVSPGDPLLPHLTAAWYNGTLPFNPPENKGKKGIVFPREGELVCLAEDATVTRFNPVGVTGLADTEIDNYRTPKVSGASVDEHNWVIPQGDLVTDGAVMCVVFGLTRAWVTTTDADDNCVVYDPSQSKLVTAREGKAQILVKGHTTFPSLINIGTQPNIVRVRGTLQSPMSATLGPYTLENLVGISFSAQELGSSISVYNLHSWEADTSANARAEWVHEESRWEFYQVDCPS